MLNGIAKRISSAKWNYHPIFKSENCLNVPSFVLYSLQIRQPSQQTKSRVLISALRFTELSPYLTIFGLQLKLRPACCFQVASLSIDQNSLGSLHHQRACRRLKSVISKRAHISIWIFEEEEEETHLQLEKISSELMLNLRKYIHLEIALSIRLIYHFTVSYSPL